MTGNRELLAWRGLAFAAGGYLIPLGAGAATYNLLHAVDRSLGSNTTINTGLQATLVASLLVSAWSAWNAYQLAEQAQRERLAQP